MKKLILSLTAALAIGAYADTGDYSYTGFDALTAGTAFNPNKDDLGGDTASYWEVVKEGDEYGVISNHTETCKVAGLDGHANYLKVETDGTIMRYAIDNGQTERTIDVSEKAGIYFDSLVQFTGADEIPASDVERTKLAVWLYKSDTEDGVFGLGTNLVVTAGYLDNAVNHVTPSNYVVSAAGISEGWHRLTVKMLPELGAASGVAGFVVFIDGVAVTSTEAKGAEGSVFNSLNATAAKWNDMGALFPSLIETGSLDAQEFTYVGFKGQGAVDELLITENAPGFAKDGTIFTLNWGAGLASLTIDGEPVDGFVVGEEGTTNINVTAGTPTYEVIATAQDGYNLGTRTVSGGVVSAGDDFTVNGTGVGNIVVNQVKFIVNGRPYSTLADAIAAAGEGGTVKLNVDIEFDPDIEGDLIALDGDNFVFDLAGHTITLLSEARSPIEIDEFSTLKIIDSVGHGKLVGGDGGSIYSVGNLTIGDADGNNDKGVTFDGAVCIEGGDCLIVRGNFDKDTNAGEELESYKDKNSTITDDGDYWVATPGGAVDKYAITWDALDNATVSAADTNGKSVESGDKFIEGTEIVFTVDPDADYTYADVEIGTWTLLEDGTISNLVVIGTEDIKVTIPEPKEAPAPTMWTVTFSTNNVAVVEVETEVEDGNTLTAEQIPAFVGGAWDVDPTDAVITCGTNFNYTISSGKTYPDYIPTGDEDVKTKFDEWVTKVNDGDRDVSSEEMDAFLLNVKPVDVETAKAAFKITSITQDEDGNWIVKACDKADGEAYLNGFVNIVPYTLSGAGEGAEFWQATLTVEPANK